MAHWSSSALDMAELAANCQSRINPSVMPKGLDVQDRPEEDYENKIRLNLNLLQNIDIFREIDSDH